MGCFVVAEFILTSASRGPFAIAEPLVHIVISVLLLCSLPVTHWTHTIVAFQFQSHNQLK